MTSNKTDLLELIYAQDTFALGRNSSGAFHELRGKLGLVSGRMITMSKKDDRKKRDELLEKGMKSLKDIEAMCDWFRRRSLLKNEDLEAADIKVSLEQEKFRLDLHFKGISEEEILPVLEMGELPDDLGEVWCNSVRLGALVSNLVGNAKDSYKGMTYKDLEKRGVEYGQVFVMASSDNDFVYIEVSDNGSGIPKELHEKIFESGFTTKAATEGTGLGMYICQEIAAEMKGELILDSQVGVGTKFTLRLPKYKVSG